MPVVVFLLYHGVGHFNACFRLAKTLRSRYKIFFAGHQFFTNYVSSQGFNYYPLKSVPYGLGFETWVNKTEKKKFVYLASLADRHKNRLFRERSSELQKLANEIQPQTILIDSLQSTDFIVLYPFAKDRGIKVGLIQTMLPTVLLKNYPPINSLAMPDDVVEIQRARNAFVRKRLFKKLFQTLIYLGKNDSAIAQDGIRKNKINPKYLSDDILPMGIPLKNIEEFILAPKEFDFPNVPSLQHRHYIGFQTDQSRLEFVDPEYLRSDEKVRKQQLNKKLIYISFGTVKSGNIKHVRSFIRKLVSLAITRPYVMVFSLQANYQELIPDYSFPENVFFFKSVPQLELLQRAGLFITHGGLNSVKEAVHAVVPLLVCPVDFNFDQPGNSSRVLFHEVGLRGDLKQDSEKVLDEKITELLVKDRFKQKLTELKNLDGNYSTESVIDLLGQLNKIE